MSHSIIWWVQNYGPGLNPAKPSSETLERPVVFNDMLENRRWCVLPIFAPISRQNLYVVSETNFTPSFWSVSAWLPPRLWPPHSLRKSSSKDPLVSFPNYIQDKHKIFKEGLEFGISGLWASNSTRMREYNHGTHLFLSWRISRHEIDGCIIEIYIYRYRMMPLSELVCWLYLQ